MKEQIVQKPPVVCILGHVDHGKSSLLEAIKDFKITSKESGGITQHIGAYVVEQNGKKITFLDTPGHEAFSAIRSRGAQVADIAILVVAADEGVKPQTIEAYECIKKAEIPFLVAINKIDKPESNPQKVKNELAQHGIFVEGMGGDVPVVETSAKTKQGINDLLEIILLVSEMHPQKVNLDVPARGVIIEAFLDSRRGPVATLLIKEGILKKQDIIATPTSCGKVRILEDFLGSPLKEAYPSTPAYMMGFEEVPKVGERFMVFDDLEKAREFVIKEREKERERKQNAYLSEEGKEVLNLIIKGDVVGSIEAIEQSIENIPQEEVFTRILKSGVGDITEDDVILADSAGAKIVGFRTKILPEAAKIADQKKVEIYIFEVIYDLIQKIREMIKNIIELQVVREDVGKLRVLVVFLSEKDKQIIGGRIFQGEMYKGLEVEIFREEKKIGQGKIINLQKEKKDIEKGNQGEEIGILLKTSTKIKEGDVLVAFTLKQKKAEF